MSSTACFAGSRTMQPYLETVDVTLLASWQNARDVKLRNAHLAIVDRSRVLDYLLNEAHPDNGGKRDSSDCSVTRGRIPNP